MEILSLDKGEANPEAWGRWWLDTFRDHGPAEGKYTTSAEAMEYGRERCRRKLASLPRHEEESEHEFQLRILNQGGGHE